MEKILVIGGATATGKTALAVECALRLGTEIISADSQLIYKGLDIGTAKPTEEEKRGVVHHLIDVVPPTDGFSVSDYRSMAMPALQKLLREGKTPVVCGGTGFYIRSLLFDLSYGNAAARPAVRRKYSDWLAVHGKDSLFEKLREVDPQTAEKLHPNDVKRVIRALEIYEVSGTKKSELGDGQEPRFCYTAIAVDYPREELYDRIDRRVDKMFACGLVDEVKGLLARGIDEKSQCMQAIGYKEIVFGLKNGDNESTMRDIIKRNTRHYAKRQLTFFKKLPNIVWLAPENATAERVTEIFYDRQL